MMFRRRDSSSSTFLPHGYVPTEKDILCGRGKANFNHPANLVFMEAISSSIDEYVDATSRIEKSVVVTSVVSNLFDSGMRFLDLDAESNQYVVLSSERSLAKVGSAIRDVLKRHKKKTSLVTATMRSKPTEARDGNLISSSHAVVGGDQQVNQELSSYISGTQGSRMKRIPSESNQRNPTNRLFSDNHIPFVGDNDLGKIRYDVSRSSNSALMGLPSSSFSTSNKTNTSKHETVPAVASGRKFLTDDTPSDRVLKAVTTTKGDAPLPIDSTTHFESQDIEELSDVLSRLDHP